MYMYILEFYIYIFFTLTQILGNRQVEARSRQERPLAVSLSRVLGPLMSLASILRIFSALHSPEALPEWLLTLTAV